MDTTTIATTPPSHRSDPPRSSRTKSSSRLARLRDIAIDSEAIPRFSLEPISPSPKSTLSRKSSDSLPLRELLLLSPSPLRRPRPARLAERLDMPEEIPQSIEPVAARRRGKSRGGQLGSPRNVRRTRRRAAEVVEVREEKDFGGVGDEKVRKRRHNVKTRKEKLSLVPAPAVTTSSSSLPKSEEGDVGGNFDKLGQVMSDLFMWRDVAKSSLWFGFGCLCFLSSCFAGGVNFSVFSAMSQLGLLFLGLSFFKNSVAQRNSAKSCCDFKLKEDDILRMARLILPAVNFAISKTRELFSGEPSMTLKVAPILLLGAEYGHIITFRRLFAAGFFISFTIPKLYSRNSTQISKKANYLRGWVLEAWLACSHKKMVAGFPITTFWKLTSVKTRTVAVFIVLVVLQCYRQKMQLESAEGEVGKEVEEQEQVQQPQQALIVAEVGSQK